MACLKNMLETSGGKEDSAVQALKEMAGQKAVRNSHQASWP